jgi:hypothetical protein
MLTQASSSKERLLPNNCPNYLALRMRLEKWTNEFGPAWKKKECRETDRENKGMLAITGLHIKKQPHFLRASDLIGALELAAFLLEE